MKLKALLVSFLLLFVLSPVRAEPTPDTDSIPPSLEEWKPWVLHGYEDHFCPSPWNDPDTHRCTWPSRLKLDLEESGGVFTQEWVVFKESRVPLPGDSRTWPVKVRVNKAPAVVVAQGDGPSLFLPTGRHVVKGGFAWSGMPETLRVPAASGLIRLTIDGKPVAFPVLGKDSRLWLKKRQPVRSRQDRLDVKVYRLLEDAIPMKMTTHFRVHVSGKARKLELESALLGGFRPMRILSRLPARLTSKGSLVIQARAGRWDVRVETLSRGPVHEIPAAGLEYGDEIWSFDSRNHLRMVKVMGVPSVEPGRTDLPREWKGFPAFLVGSDDRVRFQEIRRGDPEPAPDRLHLHRTWWLDFNGRGYTVHDRVTGTMSRNWTLAMNPPFNLGRVAVDGVDRLITSHGKDGKPGVELRKGVLHLEADSRIESSICHIPAVGWDHDFESVSAKLHLPPGWLLVKASGVDGMSGTWLQRWTLLDLFLVLIISLAVLKLWDWKWSVAALVTLALIYHEPGAPRLVWLHLLAATALLRYVPAGWFARLIKLWRLGSLVVLVVFAVPFMIQQARWGVYPQLRTPVRAAAGLSMQDRVKVSPEIKGKPAGKIALKEGQAMETAQEAPSSKVRRYSRKKSGVDKKQAVTLLQDPNALIQTGPGLPRWKQRSFAIKWNGPVKREQKLNLWLFPPWVNLILAFVQIALLALLIFRLMEVRQWRLPKGHFVLTCLLLCSVLFPGISGAGLHEKASPGPKLLEQLRERLLEGPECMPECADIPEMNLDITPDELRIILFVHAAADTSIPLPGSADQWRSGKILLDGFPADGLAADTKGRLWLFLPEGIHEVTLSGGTYPGGSFQIPLPLKPRRVSIQNRGWQLKGVDRDGLVQGSIQLKRKQEAVSGKPEGSSTGELPPFLHVKRVLSLGLEWKVYTTVTRLSPRGAPVVASVPLLMGESVVTQGVQVESGEALIRMGPESRRIAWVSGLDKADSLRLKAPASVPWAETWILDASPVWHCELSGIPVIHHQDKRGHWRPQWNPWPGEEVTIRVTRPKAIPGEIVTIDGVRLTLTPGSRFTRAELSLAARTSRGEQHTITLPEGARVQHVRINNKGQPIKPDEREVIVPLRPGRQTVQVEWHGDTDSSLMTRAPEVDIGKQAVNSDTVFKMPGDRWILLAWGPTLGPAVLFWSYFVVIILAAIGLGRVDWTPLKTRHWLLLGLGLTQTHPLVAIMVIGWLLALGLRRKYAASGGWLSFNVSQVILVMWTLAALIGLYTAIQKGLLGLPGMQITGNGSSNFWLHWTQDRIGSTLPRPLVLSLPLIVFRVLMLLWALWLAYSLLKWLKWGWRCFSEGGLWKKIVLRKRRPESTGTARPGVPPDEVTDPSP